MRILILLLGFLFFLSCSDDTADGGGTETVIGLIEGDSTKLNNAAVSFLSEAYNPKISTDTVYKTVLSPTGGFELSIPKGAYVIHILTEDKKEGRMSSISLQGKFNFTDSIGRVGTLNMVVPGLPESGGYVYIEGTPYWKPLSAGEAMGDTATNISLIDIPPFDSLDIYVVDSVGKKVSVKKDAFLLPGTYQVVDHWILWD